MPGDRLGHGLRGDMIVRAAFARIDIVAFSIAAGTLLGLVLLLATEWLLVKGAPPGQHIGPHLGLMANYLPGYSVSWSGAIVGLFYGFLMGVILGVAFGVVWNIVHYLYLMKLGGIRKTAVLDV